MHLDVEAAATRLAAVQTTEAINRADILELMGTKSKVYATTYKYKNTFRSHNKECV